MLNSKNICFLLFSEKDIFIKKIVCVKMPWLKKSRYIKISFWFFVQEKYVGCLNILFSIVWHPANGIWTFCVLVYFCIILPYTLLQGFLKIFDFFISYAEHNLIKHLLTILFGFVYNCHFRGTSPLFSVLVMSGRIRSTGWLKICNFKNKYKKGKMFIFLNATYSMFSNMK